MEFGERETRGEKGFLVSNHGNRSLVSFKYNFNNQQDGDAEQVHPGFSDQNGRGGGIGMGEVDLGGEAAPGEVDLGGIFPF